MAPLSPAAQAVLDAYLDDWAASPWSDGQCLAAALRAAADQVVPEMKPWLRTSGASAAKHDVRQHLLAIAVELEAADA